MGAITGSSGTPPLSPEELKKLEEKAKLSAEMKDMSEIAALYAYIRQANTTLATGMDSMQKALDNLNQITGTLTAIQNMHNNIAIPPAKTFDFDMTRGVNIPVVNGTNVNLGGHMYAVPIKYLGDYVNAYKEASSKFFGSGMDPFFALQLGTPAYDSFIKTMDATKSQLKDEIAILTKTTPAEDLGKPNTLLSTLKQVLSELPDTSNYTSVNTWLIDHYATHGAEGAESAGKIQGNINAASSAATSLNDTQKAKTQSLLQLTTQYYQSATSLLDAIKQIMVSMAKHVGG